MKVYCLFGVKDLNECDKYALLGIYSTVELSEENLYIERDKEYYSLYYIEENEVKDQ